MSKPSRFLRRVIGTSEANQVNNFAIENPAIFSLDSSPRADFPRPLGAARPHVSAVQLTDDELRELRADVAAARLVLEAAQRGHVTPGEAIEAAIIRLGQ